MQNEQNSYQAKWDDYKNRRNVSFLVLFLTLALAFFLIYQSKNYGSDVLNLPIGYLFIFAVGLLAQVVFMVRFHAWKCPKCEKRFFVSTFSKRSPIFLDNCQNCQLPKYFGSSYYSK